jgi:hypothetical protein
MTSTKTNLNIEELCLEMRELMDDLSKRNPRQENPAESPAGEDEPAPPGKAHHIKLI